MLDVYEESDWDSTDVLVGDKTMTTLWRPHHNARSADY